MLRRQLLDLLHRIPGAHPWHRDRRDARRTELVVATDRPRRQNRLDLHQRLQGHHVAVETLDKDGIDILRILAVQPIGLDNDLVHLPVEVDIVDIARAQIVLQRGEYLAHRNLEHLCLGAVDIDEQVGGLGRVATEGHHDLRGDVQLHQEPLQGRFQLLRIVVPHGLQLEVEATASPQPHDRGRDEQMYLRIRECTELGPQTLLHRHHGLGRILALIPVLQADHQQAHILP